MRTVIVVPLVLAALVAVVVFASAHQLRRSSERTTDQASQDALRMRGVRTDGWNRGI